MTDWPLEHADSDASESSLLVQYRVGPGKNFVYFVADLKSKRAALVDPAWNPLALLAEARVLGFEPACVLLTHTHPDHLGGRLHNRLTPGVCELTDEIDLPVYVHESEAEYVLRFADLPERLLHPFSDASRIDVGALTVDCLHTPGHTPGCACFHVDGRLISGDTLFVRSVGNTDHPKGDVDALYTSLRRLEKLPQETKIYPGHDTGEETSSTLGRELEINAYFRPMESEQFRILMGYLQSPTTPGNGADD